VILEKFCKDGADKLHLVADYDGTLLRSFYEDGRMVPGAPRIYFESNYFSNDCRQLLAEHGEGFRALLADPDLKPEELQVHSMAWYRDDLKILLKARINKKDLPSLVKEAEILYRDGTKEMFECLNELDVPILVYSAGLGDVIHHSLEHEGALLPNVTVISNHIEYDEDGVPLKLSDRYFNRYNKTAETILDYFDEHKSRKNALLIGDNIGDCTMVQGAHYENVLKIGFLSYEIDKRMDDHLKHFDIVIMGDQSMNVVQAVLNAVINNEVDFVISE